MENAIQLKYPVLNKDQERRENGPGATLRK